jgi:hypothetical protein
MNKETIDNHNIPDNGPEPGIVPAPIAGPEGSQSLAKLVPADVTTSELGAYLRQRTVEAQMGLLLQKTPRREIRTRLLNPKEPEGPRNPRLKYLEHAYVTETLNLLFGFNWDLEVLDQERINNEAVVRTRLRVRLADGSTIVKDSFGGANYQPNNPNSSWADTMKAAQSDALKAAAARLGIGLDLYRREEKEKPALTAGNGPHHKPQTGSQNGLERRSEGEGRSPEATRRGEGWNWFWGVKMKELGLSREEVHSRLGVGSVTEWTSQGKSLEEAVKVLEGQGK